MSLQRKIAVSSLAAALALGIGAIVEAQFSMSLPEGMEASLDESRAWQEAQAGNHIKARELAERVVQADPESFAGHFVLGFVHHYGEANFARALYYTSRAHALFVARYGDHPTPPAPWRWHARIVRELVWVHADLEHYDEQLRWMARYSELYEPDFVAERAWPFMKMRRFAEAREAAALGQASGDPQQEEIALNALCAIEFEAGNDDASYRACRAAMELRGANPAIQSAVDFTNFAEAARSVFRLDEAERTDRLATEAQVSWYGNAWVELAELYVREARHAEALEALRQAPIYRNKRPPHVRDSDRSEGRRALASFFLIAGRAEDAVRVSQEALAAPDRRAHQSRDPAQDVAIAALLDRASRRLLAERLIEDAVDAPLHERAAAWLRAQSARWMAWQSGRTAARNLADEDRLVGTFMIGTHRSAVMPPWLAGELVDVLGPGVVREAVRRARSQDRREGAAAYYDAFEAEAALAAGDPERALELAARAQAGLGPGEALLGVRALAVEAQAARELARRERSLAAYDRIFQADPGLMRRLGWSVPARFSASGEIAEEVASLLAASPRLETGDWGLSVRIEADRSQGRACLVSASGAVLGCGEARAEAGDDADRLAGRIADAFHAQVFAPRVDLSQADASGLDGSNRTSRDPLRTLFDPGEE